MRQVLFLPMLLLAAGCAKEPKVEVPAAPAALTAADVTGSYVGTTTVQGPDSVLTSTWAVWVATNASGGLDGKVVGSTAPTDTVTFSMTLSGDSTINVSAPFTEPGSPAGSPQMTWRSVGHGTGNSWTGTVDWMAVGSDSVVRSGTWTGTRTP